METAIPKYLIIYALIVIPLAVSFFFIRRSSAKPSTLDLLGKEKSNSDLPPTKMPQKASADSINTRRAYYDERRREARREMSLNVLFNWNGFTWDAYEVLGLPAGSSLETVKAAFEKARSQCDQESLPFFEAAYNAIRHSSSTRG